MTMRMGRSPRFPGGSAQITLALGVAAAASCVFWSPASPEWTAPSSQPPHLGAIEQVSAQLTSLVPLGDRTQRIVFEVQLWILAVSVVACWCGYNLFRGPARHVSAAATAPLTAFAVVAWATDRAQTPLAELAFAFFALLALSALVRPLVHLGRVTRPAAARSLAASATAATLDPLPGVLLAAVVVGIGTLRAARVEPWRLRFHGPGWMIALTPALALASALVALQLAPPWGELDGLHVELPDVARLRSYIGATLLYPAGALVLLLVMPLRWRGGITIFVFVTGALFLRRGDHSLAPTPAALACLSVAAAGWVWLAGSVTRRHRRVGFTLGAVATAIVLTVAIRHATPSLDELVHARNNNSRLIAHQYLKALSVPGDILFVHDPRLGAELATDQREEGLRPDLTLVGSDVLAGTAPDAAHPAWRDMGRRVVSDSFDLAGHWDPTWAIEIGPLFWFVFDPTIAGEHTTDAPLPTFPGWPLGARGRWDGVKLEHARFRRATGRELDAFNMLPLPPDERQSLRASAQVARAVRLTALRSTELPLDASADPFKVPLAAIAEAGDMLYESGDHELGAHLLREAANGGHHAAWGALARWQFRAGHEEAANEVFEHLARTPTLRAEAVAVLDWLTRRGELSAAISLRRQLDSGQGSVGELGARLRLLQKLTVPGGAPPFPPPASDLTKRVNRDSRSAQ